MLELDFTLELLLDFIVSLEEDDDFPFMDDEEDAISEEEDEPYSDDEEFAILLEEPSLLELEFPLFALELDELSPLPALEELEE